MEIAPHTLTNFDVSALDFSAAHFQLLICMSSPGVIQVTEWRTITVQVASEMNPQYLSDTSPSSLGRERRHSGGQHILSRFPVGLYNYSCSDSSSLSLHMKNLDSHPVFFGACVHPYLMASSQRGDKVEFSPTNGC